MAQGMTIVHAYHSEPIIQTLLHDEAPAEPAVQAPTL